MTDLTIHPEKDPHQILARVTEPDAIASALAEAGVTFERWPTVPDLGAGADPDGILTAYAPHIERLKAQGGYVTADVVRMAPDHPDRARMRQMFLSEHTHAEDEVRFFVAGSGLFMLHVEERVYALLCTRGDLIRVPALTRHWFDMGAAPSFTAIRLFCDPSGWVATSTGDAIADQFPRLGSE